MDEWMQCCDDADVVSFDIFDTLTYFFGRAGNWAYNAYSF